MTTNEMLVVIEEGVRNHRISPHLAAFIAAQLHGSETDDQHVVDWEGLPEDSEPSEQTA